MSTTYQDLLDLFQEIAQAQKENERRSQETDRQIKETDRQIKETDQQLKALGLRFQESERMLAEDREQLQRTRELWREQSLEAERRLERRMERLDERLGRLGNRLGEFAESLVRPSLVELFQARGLAVREVHPNVEVKRDGEAMQIDLLVVDGAEAILVEVKSKLAPADVDEHLARLEKFKRLMPRYADVRALGAVAAMVVPDDAARYAYRQGLYVLAQAGVAMAILNDDRFRPRVW